MNDIEGLSADQTAKAGKPTSEMPEGASGDWRREHFIPLRKSDLVRMLEQDASLHGGAPCQFKQLCRLLSATIHHHYYKWLEELKDLYAPFNPDSVTWQKDALTDEQRQALIPDLFDRFTALLQRANYRCLSRDELNQAVGVASDWGVRLHVDFSVFARLEVYVRGDVVEERKRRSWRTYYKNEPVEVPVYQRLVVMFLLCDHADAPEGCDPRGVHVKVFKNIPKADLDMLLPGSRFAMSLMDRGKILLPTITGLAIAILKIVKGVLLLAFAGLYGILAVIGLVGGTIGYGVKSFLGYLRTKEKYQLNLTRSLYYQNLDNNGGVICRILDEAEEQELLEAILAYALLIWKADASGWTADQLDKAAEHYLTSVLKRDVDFEVHDALDKLERFGCATKTPDGRWQATPMEDALVTLDRAWDDYFRYNNGGDGKTAS